MSLTCVECDGGARFGLLCERAFDRLRAALEGDGSDNPTFALAWPAFSRVVLAHGRLVTPEVEGKPRGFESGMLYPAVRAQVEEIDAILAGLAVAGGDPARWVMVHEGALDAVTFTLRSRAFRRNNPLAEPDRKLRPARWRCPNEYCASVNPDPELLVVQPRPDGDGVSERLVQCAFCAHTLSMGEALRLAREEEWRHERVEVAS